MWGECTGSIGEVGRSNRKVLLGCKKEEKRKIFRKGSCSVPCKGSGVNLEMRKSLKLFIRFSKWPEVKDRSYQKTLKGNYRGHKILF